MKTLLLILLVCVGVYLLTVGGIAVWMIVSLRRQGIPWAKSWRLW